MKSVSINAASAITGVHPAEYLDAIRRGHFGAAPVTRQGVPRQLDRDDVLALSVKAQLVAMGIASAQAWQLATDVRRFLRDDDEIDQLWITTTKAGKPRRVVTVCPTDTAAFTIPVAYLRAEITRRVQARMNRGARN